MSSTHALGARPGGLCLVHVFKAPGPRFWFYILLAASILVLANILMPDLFAQARLPGQDASDKLEVAGTLLRIIDTALFKWGARIFAGICIFSAGWALKEQRFGVAIVSLVGALIVGSAPMWVRNIFAIGGGDSVFGN